jgi:HAD superfamily hydrolase (TIGR01509 family)
VTATTGPLLDGTNLEAVLFDLDGTLLDSKSILEDVFWRFLDAHGIDRAAVDISAFDGLKIPEIVAALRRRWSLEESETTLTAAYLDAVRRSYTDSALPFDGVDRMLGELRGRGLKLALVTAATDAVLTPLLARLGWSGLFDVVISGDRVTRGKPAPDGYVAALHRLNLSPGRAVAVEDSRHGVTAATAAGLFTIGIAPPDRAAELTAAGALTVLARAAQVADLLRGRERRPA